MTVRRSSFLSRYKHVSKVFSVYSSSYHRSSSFTLPDHFQTTCLEGSSDFFGGTRTQKNLLITYASRGQETQKKDKTIKGQRATYSIKCLASSFALKQDPLIQLSLLNGKQNRSSYLSYSGQIFKNSINNCISCSTVPLDRCGA